MTLRLKRVGESRLTPNNILLGCAPSAGLYGHEVNTAEVVYMIETAILKYGIKGIDTAPWYGCGRSELDIGAAFNSRWHKEKMISKGAYVVSKVGRVVDLRANCKRDDPRVAWENTGYVINDKTGHQVCVHDYTAAGIYKAFEGTKQRLQGAPLRTIRLHDCDTEERFTEFISQGGLEALASLKIEGKVERISIGINDPHFLLRLIESAPPGTFDDVMMAGCWNLIEFEKGLPVLKKCSQEGIQIHLAGVFGAGLLWGGSNYKYDKANKEVVERRNHWNAIATKFKVPLPSLALKFAFAPTVVSHVAIGCRTVNELDSNMRAIGFMPDNDTFVRILAEAEAAGLIPGDLFFGGKSEETRQILASSKL